MLALLFAATFGPAVVNAAHPTALLSQIDLATPQNVSLDTTSCPGYTLSNLQNSSNGITASLTLAGPACNAFGQDVQNLTLQVTYETSSRLHVNIFDTANQQFTIPDSVIAPPDSDPDASADSSDLAFNFEENPFAFWITRKSEPDAAPLFDTRQSSLPSTPIAPQNPDDPSTAINSTALVFEDLYLQLTSALPMNTNIYGLGEVIASSGFRRAIEGSGSLTTVWARDVADPVDQNEYGTHPVYLEHRFNPSAGSGSSRTHGVFLKSAAGEDMILQTPSGANTSMIQYRAVGGTLDLYFFSGPTPTDVIQQYGAAIGLPTWMPMWSFGYHLCRWGYANVSETAENVRRMREANIPLETQWNDIDIYQAFRDFTTDKGAFPGDELREFIQNLTDSHQHYIPIVDAGIAITLNDTDVYDPYTKGTEQKVFVTNPDGSQYIGQVWPGFTVWPDWFANNTQSWWTEAFRNWSSQGVEFSGIWLDMNEASSFCTGSCGDWNDVRNTTPPFILPGEPGGEVTAYPEGYNSTISGPSGNMTVNGTLTFQPPSSPSQGLKKRQVNLHPRRPDVKPLPLARRGLGSGNDSIGDFINNPPYAIHNGAGILAKGTIAPNATHVTGSAELDTHNMFGMMEEKATHAALMEVRPNQRPFIIGRSTFPSTGKWSGHWLGDNFSTWRYLYLSIQGVLQFQIFQIPMVGADTCGFNGNTDEELCNRWQQLSAFHPFYRNHNTKGAISQEPYRWDSVANATRIATAARYALLPYWYTLFANASLFGSPTVKALWMEFPEEEELFGVDRQFLVGSSILVTSVLEPNVTSVDGIFPGRGNVTWRDWWTHEVVQANSGANTTLSAPLSHINVHIRDNTILLLHQNPAYTTNETRQGPYALLVALNSGSQAVGDAFVDDGESYPPGPSRILNFAASNGTVAITSQGNFTIEQKIDTITVLGVGSKPNTVTFGGQNVGNWTYLNATQELVASGVGVDLNQGGKLEWS